MKLPVYLDNNATTQLDATVLSKMLPYLNSIYGNASSSHKHGLLAREAVQVARKQVATLLNAIPKEIIFTSGATESNNLAILGIAEQYNHKGRHIVTSSIEHKSVLDSCKHLEKLGYEVTYLSPDTHGQISPEKVVEVIRPDTVLVSIMFANNEIGTINPIKEIRQVCPNAILHTDATQAVGKIDIDVNNLGVDLISLSGHKIHGPKGVGALYIRNQRNKRIRITPQTHGGSQEDGIRSGTSNVAGIVGLGEACVVTTRSDALYITELTNSFLLRLKCSIDNVKLNGHPTERLYNTLNLSFGDIYAEPIIEALYDNVSVSSGSACNSSDTQPSHVLLGIGLNKEQALSGIRFSFGKHNTPEEIEFVANKVISVVKRLSN